MDKESTMRKEPLISVLMNCYNGEKYLREAIESVLAQTYQNWELVFWDNQSTDRSAEIFKSYVDPRLKYFYAPQHTLLYEARNYALEKANGEFISFLDVDDWWAPTKLEMQIPLFSDLEVGLVCGNHWYKNELKDKYWKRFKSLCPTGWVLNDLLKSYFVGLLTLVVRRSALDSLDYPCDPRYHVIGDFDLVVRLSVRWKLDCVQQPIAFHRLHDGNGTIKNRSRHTDELECWFEEMKEIETIRSCSNFHCVKLYSIYLKAIHKVLNSDKKGAYDLLYDLSWGYLKFKLYIALLLPVWAVKKLKK